MGKLKLLNGVDTIYDHKTGERSQIVSRAAGKTTFVEEYGSNQTDETIITPASGKRAMCSWRTHINGCRYWGYIIGFCNI